MRGLHVGAVMMVALAGGAGVVAAAPDDGDMAAATKPGDVGSAAILLNRGASTVTMLTDPPRLLGVSTDISVADGALTGVLDGGKYDVKLVGDRAQGSGPNGPIDVQLQDRGGATGVVGTWNGRKIDMEVGPEAIRGRVVRAAVEGTRSLESCRYDVDSRKGDSLSGPSRCIGSAEPMRMTLQPATDGLASREAALIIVAFIASPPPAKD